MEAKLHLVVEFAFLIWTLICALRSVHQENKISIHPSISVYLSIFHLSTYLPVYLSIYLPIYMHTYYMCVCFAAFPMSQKF